MLQRTRALPKVRRRWRDLELVTAPNDTVVAIMKPWGGYSMSGGAIFVDPSGEPF